MRRCDVTARPDKRAAHRDGLRNQGEPLVEPGRILGRKKPLVNVTKIGPISDATMAAGNTATQRVFTYFSCSTDSLFITLIPPLTRCCRLSKKPSAALVGESALRTRDCIGRGCTHRLFSRCCVAPQVMNLDTGQQMSPCDRPSGSQRNQGGHALLKWTRIPCWWVLVAWSLLPATLGHSPGRTGGLMSGAACPFPSRSNTQLGRLRVA